MALTLSTNIHLYDCLHMSWFRSRPSIMQSRETCRCFQPCSGRVLTCSVWRLCMRANSPLPSQDTGISSKAMSIMNSFINDIFEKIGAETAVSF